MADTSMTDDVLNNYLTRYLGPLPQAPLPGPNTPAAKFDAASLPPIQVPGMMPPAPNIDTTPEGIAPQPAAPPAAAPVIPVPGKGASSIASSLPPIPFDSLGVSPETKQTVANAASLENDRKSGIDHLWDKTAHVNNPFLRALSRIGVGGLKVADSVGGAVFPEFAAGIPGTAAHHDYVTRQGEEFANQALGREQTGAQAVNEQAQANQTALSPELREAGINVNAQKIMNQLTTKEQALHGQAVRAGLRVKVDALGQVARDALGNVSYEPDPDSLSFKKQQVSEDLARSTKAKNAADIELKHARADLDEAMKAGYDPTSPIFQQRERRLRIAQTNSETMAANHDLAEKRFGAQYFGVVDGQVVPGTMQLPDGTPVGSVNAVNVRPTSTERTAAGRADTMDSIQTRIEKDLTDPEIRDYLGPVGGRLAEAQGKLGTLPEKVAKFQNDLISYGAFQAGLHPVRGIGALEYFERVMGGLHQTPDELLGKLKSNKETSSSVKNVGNPNVGGAGGGAKVRVQKADGTTGSVPSANLQNWLAANPGAVAVQ